MPYRDTALSSAWQIMFVTTVLADTHNGALGLSEAQTWNAYRATADESSAKILSFNDCLQWAFVRCLAAYLLPLQILIGNY